MSLTLADSLLSFPLLLPNKLSIPKIDDPTLFYPNLIFVESSYFFTIFFSIVSEGATAIYFMVPEKFVMSWLPEPTLTFEFELSLSFPESKAFELSLTLPLPLLPSLFFTGIILAVCPEAKSGWILV